MSLADTLLKELERESETTRRVLERVPEDKLAWKPHEKSMSLGRLATHVAEIPGVISTFLENDKFTFADQYTPRVAGSQKELLDTFDQSLAEAKRRIASFDDAAMSRSWEASTKDKPVTAMPRAAALRFILLNHMYHHRGQLSVYLRLLDVPVPMMYGPSADENPWK